MRLKELRILREANGYRGTVTVAHDGGEYAGIIGLDHAQCEAILDDAKWELGKISITLSYVDFMKNLDVVESAPTSVTPDIPF